MKLNKQDILDALKTITVPGEGQNIMRFNGNYDNLFRLDEYDYREPHILEFR